MSRRVYPTPSLGDLDRWSCAAYAVACSQRYVELAIRFDDSSARALSTTLARIVNDLWDDVESRDLPKSIDRLRDNLLPLLAIELVGMSPISTDIVQRVSSIALHAVNSVAGDPDAALYAGREAYEVQDLVGSLALNVHTFDARAEQSIVESPYVRFEIAEQNKDVASLMEDSTWTEKVRDVRLRANRASQIAADLVGAVLGGT